MTCIIGIAKYQDITLYGHFFPLSKIVKFHRMDANMKKEIFKLLC